MRAMSLSVFSGGLWNRSSALASSSMPSLRCLHNDGDGDENKFLIQKYRGQKG